MAARLIWDEVLDEAMALIITAREKDHPWGPAETVQWTNNLETDLRRTLDVVSEAGFSAAVPQERIALDLIEHLNALTNARELFEFWNALFGVYRTLLTLEETVLVSDLASRTPEMQRRLKELDGHLRARAADVSFRSGEEAQRRLTQTVLRAEQSTSHLEEATGKEAVDSLASHFEAYELDESTKAAKNERIYLALLAVGSLLAVFVYVQFIGDNFFSAEAAKLGLVLPVYFVAGYFARLSGQHRATAHRAKEIAVRLRTLNAYLDASDESVGKQIRADFGRELFSVAHLSGTGNGTGTEDLNKVASVVESVQRITGAAASPKA
jgi:hypothetical protein